MRTPSDTERMQAVEAPAATPDGDMITIPLESGAPIYVLKTEFDALVKVMNEYEDGAKNLIAGRCGEGRIEVSPQGHIVKLDLSYFISVYRGEYLRAFGYLEILDLTNTDFKSNRSLGEALYTLPKLRWFRAPNGEIFKTHEMVSQYINYLLALPEELSDGPPLAQKEPPPEEDADPSSPRTSRIWLTFAAVNFALIGAGLAFLLTRTQARTAERDAARAADFAPPPPKDSPPPPALSPRPTKLQVPEPPVVPEPREAIEAPNTIEGNFKLIAFNLNAKPTIITMEGALEGDTMGISIGSPYVNKDDETVSLVEYTITLKRGKDTYVQRGVTRKDFFNVLSEDEIIDTFEVDGMKYPVKINIFGNLTLERRVR